MILYLMINVITSGGISSTTTRITDDVALSLSAKIVSVVPRPIADGEQCFVVPSNVTLDLIARLATVLGVVPRACYELLACKSVFDTI